jgi:excisionase family DNA binding protein
LEEFMARFKRPAAAEYLGINPRHLRALTEQGVIPVFKVGKFTLYDSDDLDRFLASTRREATHGPLAPEPARRGRRSA